MRGLFEGDRGCTSRSPPSGFAAMGGTRVGLDTFVFRWALKVGVVRVIQLGRAHRGADAISRRGLIPVSRYSYILPVLPKSRVRCSIISKTQERY